MVLIYPQAGFHRITTEDTINPLKIILEGGGGARKVGRYLVLESFAINGIISPHQLT